MEEEADWEQLKKDLNDPLYVEEFMSAALAMIFAKDNND